MWLASCCWIPQGLTVETNPHGVYDWARPRKFIVSPPIRAGGGPIKVNTLMTTQKAGNMEKGSPVSLGQWAKWDADTQKSLVGKLIGCSVSQSAKYNYSGHFRQWETYRSVNGLGPYLGQGNANAEAEEDCLLAYLALSVGPPNKDKSTMISHLHGIGHFHKLKLGSNPIANMPSVQLMARG